MTNNKPWGKFLSGFHWQAYGTPTFRDVVSYANAQRAVEAWVRELGEDVYCFAGFERGSAGGRTHCHALLGGLSAHARDDFGNASRLLAIAHARHAWRHGNVELDAYDPRRGAAWYVSKFPDDGLIIGELREHRARRRRRPQRV